MAVPDYTESIESYLGAYEHKNTMKLDIEASTDPREIIKAAKRHIWRPQPQSQCTRDAHQRRDAGVAVGRERLVNPDAGEARLPGEPGHAVRAGDVVERGTDEAAVARVEFVDCVEILAQVAAGAQMGRHFLRPPCRGPGGCFARRGARRRWYPHAAGPRFGASSRALGRGAVDFASQCDQARLVKGGMEYAMTP